MSGTPRGVSMVTLISTMALTFLLALLARALRCAQAKLPARSVQIFQLSVVDGWSAEKIATALCLSRPQVYLARHRAARLVKREVDRLRRELE